MWRSHIAGAVFMGVHETVNRQRHRRWCLVSGLGMAQRPVNLGRDQRGETGRLCGGWLNAIAEAPDSGQATTTDKEKIRK